MRRRLLSLILALMLLCSVSITAYAQDVPDLDRTGSISVTMKYKGDPVPFGKLTLYRVGELVANDGDYSFQPTENFAKCVASFDDVDLGSEALAKKLADFANPEWAIETRTVSKDGELNFRGLELGLYLVVQTKPANGFEAIDPFLVTVPRYLDGQYVYDVEATSKMDVPQPTQPETTEPTKPGGKLPQTGQLNWPVPAMVAGGLALFAFGWILCFGKKKETYEE